MRIALVCNPSSPHVQRWVAALTARGHEVRTFAPEGLDVKPGIETERFGGAGSGVLATRNRARDLARQLRDFGAEIVHAHYVLNFGTWAVLAGVRPVVVSAWGSDLFVAPGQSRANAWKVRRALKGADAVTFNSDALGDAAGRLGAPADRLHKIVFGVDTSVFAPDPNHTPGPTVTFLSTRQHEQLYHVADIIEGYARALARSGDISLVVSSSGSQSETLRARAQDLGIDDQVEFTGRVSDEEMVRLYQGADAYVTVPETDSIAVSLLEAMATGLPAIASDLWPNREWLDGNEEGGLLVPVGDANSIADAMTQLASDAGLRRAMGARNRVKTVAEGDWATEVAKMEALYERLLRGVRRKGGGDR